MIRASGTGVGSGTSRQTFRLFFLGAGFSKPAGLPLANELLEPVLHAIRPYASGGGTTHLDDALWEYQQYLDVAQPDKPFDVEEFGAWLDWSNTLALDSTDCDAGLALAQLRWGIGRVLHRATPEEIPEEYLAFARELDVSDVVITLNYDCLLERALDAVSLPYRRFPMRYQNEIGVVDLSRGVELQLMKLHGSLDWALFRSDDLNAQYSFRPLAEGPRPLADPLAGLAVIPADRLDDFYSSAGSWWRYQLLLMPPSRAKPLAGSPLVELWGGSGSHGIWSGGLCVVGCSLPQGDPYIRQLLYWIARRYVETVRDGSGRGPMRNVIFIDKRDSPDAVAAYKESYRFVDPGLSEFLLRGFDVHAVAHIAKLSR
ncbi:MAG: hypothetical protein JWO62_2116 [Acidimicrobiaceae bacterium]|nr:hypothetical protein [Acidimicrobiaceae bacterium]